MKGAADLKDWLGIVAAFTSLYLALKPKREVAVVYYGNKVYEIAKTLAEIKKAKLFNKYPFPEADEYKRIIFVGLFGSIPLYERLRRMNLVPDYIGMRYLVKGYGNFTFIMARTPKDLIDAVRAYLSAY